MNLKERLEKQLESPTGGKMHSVIFDLDGTIFDTRYMVLRTLLCYSHVLPNLALEKITKHEDRIDYLIDHLPNCTCQMLHQYYAEHYHDEASYMACKPLLWVLNPFRDFFEEALPKPVLPYLCTGRPESLRHLTIEQLIEFRPLGPFSHSLPLFMSDERKRTSPEAKVAAFKKIREKSRVIAFVDNEPDVLAAIAHEDNEEEILLVYVETVRTSPESLLPARAFRLTDPECKA